MFGDDIESQKALDEYRSKHANDKSLLNHIIDFFKSLIYKVRFWNYYSPSLTALYYDINNGRYTNAEYRVEPLGSKKRELDYNSISDSNKRKVQRARILWGHPAIGKTTYLEQQQDILEWDQEVNPKRNEFIRNQVDPNHELDTSSKEFKKLRSNYMINWKNEPEYINFLTKEWNKLKDRANREGKRLFASPTPLLEMFNEDFDVIVNIPDEVFIERDVRRGGKEQNSRLWKQSINEILKTLPSSKIITTSEYFSEFMRSNFGTVWGNITEDVKNNLIKKGWTEEMWNQISQEEREQAIRCS